MTTCAIMQPTYLPWIGYFDLIDAVDVFVFLDTVQLTRRSWQVRNRLKGPKSQELMLTIPVKKTKARDDLRILDAEVDNDVPWRSKHLGALRDNYAEAPFSHQISEMMVAVRLETTGSLCAITSNIVRDAARAMHIDTPLIMASEMGPLEGKKDAQLLEICRAVRADRYLSAKGSADYIEREASGGAFAGSGVELCYQNYDHPTYPQLGIGFLPFMGIPDLIANVGFDDSLKVIRSGRRPPLSSADIRAQRAEGA